MEIHVRNNVVEPEEPSQGEIFQDDSLLLYFYHTYFILLMELVYQNFLKILNNKG